MSEAQEATSRLLNLVNQDGCDIATLLDLLSEHKAVSESDALMASLSIIKQQFMNLINKADELIQYEIAPALREAAAEE